MLNNESSAGARPTQDARLRLTGVALVLQTTSRMDSTPEPYVKRIDSWNELWMWLCQASKQQQKPRTQELRPPLHPLLLHSFTDIWATKNVPPTAYLRESTPHSRTAVVRITQKRVFCQISTGSGNTDSIFYCKPSSLEGSNSKLVFTGSPTLYYHIYLPLFFIFMYQLLSYHIRFNCGLKCSSW